MSEEKNELELNSTHREMIADAHEDLESACDYAKDKWPDRDPWLERVNEDVVYCEGLLWAFQVKGNVVDGATPNDNDVAVMLEVVFVKVPQ